MFAVTYHSPAVNGVAHVDAAGIESARSEARIAVSHMTGYPLGAITPIAIARNGITLWWNPDLYTPTELELNDARAH